MKRLVVLGLLAGLLVGCASQPIYNVQNHPIPVVAQKLPLDRIETVIIQAGQSRNWKFQRAGEGHLIAVQDDPKYSATVDIYFDHRSYRIIKNSTTGMKEKDGTIHPHYNFWIRNLEHDIDTYLANASLTSGGNS
jgi:hypothetical protein